jgi:hypothetical protein
MITTSSMFTVLLPVLVLGLGLVLLVAVVGLGQTAVAREDRL